MVRRPSVAVSIGIGIGINRGKLDFENCKLSNFVIKMVLTIFLCILLFLMHASVFVSYQPIVGIVTMQKNEGDILPYWLEYHSILFGIKNMVLLDSFSNNRTHSILEEWERKGLKVLYNQGPYADKGNLSLHAFRNLLPHVDIALPLDGDEFLVGFDNSTPIANKKKIFDEFRFFWELNSSTCWGMLQYYNAVNLNFTDTAATVEYFSPKNYTIHTSKKLAKLKYLTWLDHGGHKTKVSQGLCSSALNRVGLLHYHNRNSTVLAERALNDVMGFGWLPSNLTLETARPFVPLLQNYTRLRRAGGHKVKELFQYLTRGPGSFTRKHAAHFIRVGTLNDLIHSLNESISEFPEI
jgi:hypothetical protein